MASDILSRRKLIRIIQPQAGLLADVVVVTHTIWQEGGDVLVYYSSSSGLMNAVVDRSVLKMVMLIETHFKATGMSCAFRYQYFIL